MSTWENTWGKPPDPASTQLAAMAGSRESWRMVRAYIDQEYPAGIVANSPEMMDAWPVPFPEGNGFRKLVRDLFRRIEAMAAEPQRIRPAD